MNILFVCSKNKWRSRTAETIFKNSPLHKIKSAGTDDDARIKLTKNLLSWADLVFVMEHKHKKLIDQKFGSQILMKKIIVLDIPDEYEYMNEELILSIKEATVDYFN